jgi:hypothetical protein
MDQDEVDCLVAKIRYNIKSKEIFSLPESD